MSRIEDFKTAKIQIEVFWFVTPRSVMVGNQRSPWRWKQHIPVKRWYLTTKLHGLQKTST